MNKYPPLDAKGKQIGVGQMVRVVGVPDLDGMGKEEQILSRPVFQWLVGKLFRVSDFDEYGCAELDFVIPFGNSKGMHTVWIEPFLVESVGWKKNEYNSPFEGRK